MTDYKYKKKLIEVAIPLEAINKASAREKSVRQGHPSSLHQWWARRPLAACRAVLFTQLVDDPSSHPDEFPTEEDQEEERNRLFKVIEEMVLWENNTNQDVLDRARKEIIRSCGNHLPTIYDPFSGGGSIPLEAQRLGLATHGSDLNPVAVMIGKAIVEIPAIFDNLRPINPLAGEKLSQGGVWNGSGAQGLAEDLRYYAEWVRSEAEKKLGQLYPKVELPPEHGGGKANIIAWVWARTVASPNPVFANAHVPLIKSFQLSKKKGAEVWVVPEIDRDSKSYEFTISSKPPQSLRKTMERTAGICLLSGEPIPLKYIESEGRAGKMGARLMAIVAEGPRGRIYLPPTPADEDLAKNIRLLDHTSGEIEHWRSCTNCVVYGLTDFSDLFTHRQMMALTTFSDIIKETRQKIIHDAEVAGLNADKKRLREHGVGAESYADAVTVYLSFALDKLADLNNSLCRWESKAECPRNLFGKQAIPMVWDFAESNPLSKSSGSWRVIVNGIANAMNKCLSIVGNKDESFISQMDAKDLSSDTTCSVVSTDPPYYDNIPYSNLSDFFYIWMKRTLGDVFPDLFSTIKVPRATELVANRFRHGSKEGAEHFFLDGMISAISRMAEQSSEIFPTTIYYAFKQSEVGTDGVSSKGWATFLEAVLQSGYSVVGTWPIRTENSSRMMGQGNNALATSVVLVCRKREIEAETVTRAEFIRALKRELPSALHELQKANITPVDMPQASIGPGIGIFSRYKSVLESDDSPMTVNTALQIINRELDAYITEQEGEFDADTRFAVNWFEQNGMNAGPFGDADNLARARGLSVDSVKHAGIVESSAGKVRLLARDELDPDWTPTTDTHLTVWECTQYLIRALQDEGEHAAAVMLKQMGPDMADAARDLAYRLFDISDKQGQAKEAGAYNSLIAVWSDLTAQAATVSDADLNQEQLSML